MSSREHYTVNAQSIPELTNALNFVLARLADRLDKIEGVRGIATIESRLDMQGNKVTDAAQGTTLSDGVVVSQISDQALDTTSGPVFQSLTVLGDLVVGDDMSIGDYFFIKDTNDTIIHQMSDNGN